VTRPDFPFDAVLFDLDGTLVATDRFWPDAARAGALRAFLALGIERDPPSAAEWMDMVGRPIDEAFERAFPDLAAAQRAEVMAACVVEEERMLAEGRMGLLPGVEGTLTELARRGVRMGIASNCGRGYLATMVDGLGLARWIAEPRCLDSPGVADKADMIEDILLTFGTRSAVFVGDRSSDRDAAWANGLPHVHLSRGYAALGEDAGAEAAVPGLDRLVPRLLARARWIERTLAQLELPSGPCVLGVTGAPAAGKSLFARDLAGALSATGRPAVVVELARFRRDARAAPAASPLERVDGEYDLAGLESELLAPALAGAGALVERGGAPLAVPAGATVVLAGCALLHPRIARDLARVVHLAVAAEVLERRLAGRARGAGGLAALAAAREELGAYQELAAVCPPAAVALVLDASNALGPE
jgi:phosphoglycolate phosphatase-like HAD superfamily hydrolase